MRHLLLALTMFGAIPLARSWAGTITFSVDPASPAPVSPNDVLGPGPAVVIPEAALGLLPLDNLNALSFGNDRVGGPALMSQVQFSVDRLSIGLPGTAVFAESLLFEAAGDVFSAVPSVPGPGTNTLSVDEMSLGLTPGFFFDDLDALDQNGGTTPYFSVDDLSTLGLGTANDIFAGTTATLFADLESIGLDVDDDLDALMLNDAGTIGVLDPGIDSAYFSLSVFSPTTFTGSGGVYAPVAHGTPIVAGGVSAADILFTDFLGPITLAASAMSIGLDPELDELNALSSPVPEPGSLAVWAIGLTGFAIYRRRRNSQTA